MKYAIPMNQIIEIIAKLRLVANDEIELDFGCVELYQYFEKDISLISLTDRLP